MEDYCRSTVILALLICGAVGCGNQTESNCVTPPCAMPMAVLATVTSSLGGSVPGVTMTWTGTTSGTGACTVVSVPVSATQCVAPGTAGTYNLLFAASGFQEQTLSVAVPGSAGDCGCPSVQLQQVSVSMAPR